MLDKIKNHMDLLKKKEEEIQRLNKVLSEHEVEKGDSYGKITYKTDLYFLDYIVNKKIKGVRDDCEKTIEPYRQKLKNMEALIESNNQEITRAGQKIKALSQELEATNNTIK
jgi:prefoldin subunit 5